MNSLKAVVVQCAVCRTPLAFNNGFLAVCNPRGGYPDRPEETTTRYECRDCDTFGYHIALSRLAKDGIEGPGGWLKQLREKVWFNPNVGVALRDAHEVAEAFRAATMPARPYLVTQRPGPVSSNPRSITTRTRTRIMERDGFKCRRCGCGPQDSRLVVDHIVAVAKGGTAHESNLQTLCEKCNAGKSDRDPHEHDKRGR